jgi:hypothetical protein
VVHQPAGPALADDPPSKVVRYSVLRIHFSEDAHERLAGAIAEVASANQPHRSTESLAVVVNGVAFAAPGVPLAFRPEWIDAGPSMDASREEIVAFLARHLNCSVAVQQATALVGDQRIESFPDRLPHRTGSIGVSTPRRSSIASAAVRHRSSR